MERTAVRGRLTWQAATLTTVTRETASVVTIGLEPPDWPGHRAGQHLDVRLTAEDGYAAERSYSIASAPGEPLAITVERLENGEVSTYLTEELQAGDELEAATSAADTIAPGRLGSRVEVPAGVAERILSKAQCLRARARSTLAA